MKTSAFTKMVASGNDFVVIDGIKGYRVKGGGCREKNLAIRICDRKYGAGADGLLLLEKSKRADFKMRIFNPDGSEPAMCGNGARCAALFYRARSPKPPPDHAGPNRRAGKAQSYVRFETKAGIIEAEVKGDVVKLKMTDPRDLWANIDLNIGTQFYKLHYVNTGVPHTVFFVANVDTINVKEVGRQIRLHKQFQPEGANANFAQVVDGKTIKVRTYERGVEDETLACGTGSAASALLSFYLTLTKKSPVSVQTRSGEVLRVYFDFKNKGFSNVWLEGPAKIVYSGEYLL
jgi:diaminopimelate epimerase